MFYLCSLYFSIYYLLDFFPYFIDSSHFYYHWNICFVCFLFLSRLVSCFFIIYLFGDRNKSYVNKSDLTYQRSLCKCFDLDSTFMSFCVFKKVFVHRKPREGDSVHWCGKSCGSASGGDSERARFSFVDKEFSSCFLRSQHNWIYS